jgi:hypothetical protein
MAEHQKPQPPHLPNPGNDPKSVPDQPAAAPDPSATHHVTQDNDTQQGIDTALEDHDDLQIDVCATTTPNLPPAD